MANPEHLAILNKGVEVWNKWREENPKVIPDLSGAQVGWLNLPGINFYKANLSEAKLIATELGSATLEKANLSKSNLSGADLTQSNLNEANISTSNIYWTNFSEASLYEADLTGSILIKANFSKANLAKVNFTGASIGWTIFGNNDLSSVSGLESVIHSYPSTIGIDTIYQSGGEIPSDFLLGCGVHQSFIDNIPLLIRGIEPFQFNSCFISYSTKDEDFAKRLHSRLRDAKVRVWFAPEDMKGGKKLHEQIEQAIQGHDRLLLVLSEHSIKSNWVETEIRRALEVEKRENRRKLFPILLTGYDTIRNWRCFDADSGRELAVEVREYFMPDFSNWKDHDSFEISFGKLLSDLKGAA